MKITLESYIQKKCPQCNKEYKKQDTMCSTCSVWLELFVDIQEFKQDLGTWACDDYVVKSACLGELMSSIRKHIR